MEVFRLRARIQSDVLRRHQQSHIAGIPIKARKGRIAKACQQCFESKLGCDEERPCQRCRRRGMKCTSRDETGSFSPLTPGSDSATSTAPGSDQSFTPQEITSYHPGSKEFPAFFEHIMLPSDVARELHIDEPKDIFNATQNMDDINAEDELFTHDITSDLDKILDFEFAGDFSFLTPDEPQTTTQHRVAAFRDSLWNWLPKTNEDAFSEARIPPLDGNTTRSISFSHRTPLQTLKFHHKLPNSSRDAILQLVIKTSGGQLLTSSFPNADTLDTLIKIGIAKRTETDAVRRDLNYLQSSMMWLDIGIFCGYRRKMQIAESYLQPLCTALRRAGIFDRSSYARFELDATGEDPDFIEHAWHKWVHVESLKRLAYHFYGHAVEVGSAMNHPALSSYAEMTVPFPSSRDLWLAPTAQKWYSLWTIKCETAERSSLCLKDLIGDPSLFTSIPANMDAEVARFALLHALLNQAWSLQQEFSLSPGRPINKLWRQARQDDLCSILRQVNDAISRPPNTATLLAEYALMHLHVNLDLVQRFAGQLGEDEARRAYGELRIWEKSKHARNAIWHAGQVLRAARQFVPYRLRGFDSMTIYHATLVLWVFALLQRGQDCLVSRVSVYLDGEDNVETRAFVNGNNGEPGLTMFGRPGDQPRFCSLRHPRSVMDVAREKPSVDHSEDAEAHKPVPTDNVLIDQDGEIQRLPVPSHDPNDPLNFTTWEKCGIIVSCCWFSSMSLSVVGGLGAILEIFIEMYTKEGHSVNEVVWLSTFPSLFVGIGNFLILPLALVYGRRSATILSTVVLLGASVGCALSQTWEQHLGLRIIQGLAAGATESVLPLILAEITFVHQHGMVYGLYWAAQNVITGCLNLASSYEVAALGWRWYYWVFTIAIGVGLVLVIFCGFETRYNRASQYIQGRLVVTDQFGVTRVLDASPDNHPHLANTHSTADGQHTKKTYLQMLTPWSPPVQNAWMLVPQTWFHIFEAFTSPGILYATLLSSVVLGSSIGMSLSYNVVLQHNYHWSAGSIGLINLGGVFGGFGGMVYAGYFGDKFILWMAKRAGGVHAPEHRLPLLIFPGILAVISLILYGFTANGNATWGGPYMGWALFQISFVSVLILSTSFASEAWERNPGPALVAVVGTKNIVAFGLSYGINPMVEKYSYPTAMGALAAINAGVFLLGIPVYLLNPKWRRSREKKDARMST
ncbi:hypothetical protein FE257_001031 [Aspergillus nanangensis]|uniref:Zn(2)-C6 fungal-type domain-containing protein n=1 Tax=Aspergillus nanangensis TaxID=2582783 RepID=A0AAD4CTV9_ASPNN|nr:hypothetical protein FE257_001031 [Aspergillus nanangensis]